MQEVISMGMDTIVKFFKNKNLKKLNKNYKNIWEKI